jgi:hypothetical protein
VVGVPPVRVRLVLAVVVITASVAVVGTDDPAAKAA